MSVHHGKRSEGAGLRRWSFDRGLPHQQLHVLVGGAPSQQRGLILCQRPFKGLGPLTHKALTLLIAIHAHFAPPASPDEQVLPSILVEVEPGNARAHPIQLPGQQRLSHGWILRGLLVDVLKLFRNVLKQSRGLSLRRLCKCGLLQRFLGVLTWMGESVYVVCLEVVCFLQNSIPPKNVYAHSILCPLHGKGASGLVAGEVAPAGNHRLFLYRQVGGHDRNFRSNAFGVTCHTFKLNAHAGGGGLVLIKEGRVIERIDHDIHVAIVVQISQGHAMGNGF